MKFLDAIFSGVGDSWEVQSDSKADGQLAVMVRGRNSKQGSQMMLIAIDKDVEQTWDTWDADKQQNGSRKLASSIEKYGRDIRLGNTLRTTLIPADWTP